jgi:hypothetical protein
MRSVWKIKYRLDSDGSNQPWRGGRMLRRSKHRREAEWGESFASLAEVRALWRIATALTRCDSELLEETTEMEFALPQTHNPVRLSFTNGRTC